MTATYVRLCSIVLSMFIALPSLGADPPYKKYDHTFSGDLFHLRLFEVLPPDAAEYVERYRFCRHWSGEEAYDEDRAEQIRQGIEESCTGLEERAKSFHATYQEGTREFDLVRSIIKELDAGVTTPSFVRYDPLRKSAVLNEYYEVHAQFVIRSVNEQLPKYEALLETRRKDPIKAHEGATDDLKMARYMLEVQKGYLTDVIKNIDRLHPITRADIKQLQPKLLRVLAAPGE